MSSSLPFNTGGGKEFSTIIRVFIAAVVTILVGLVLLLTVEPAETDNITTFILIMSAGITALYFIYVFRYYRSKTGLEVQQQQINQKGWFMDTSVLSDSPSLFLPEGVWDDLPETAKRDISESLKALDSGASTAALLMMVRATESMILEWYRRRGSYNEQEIHWIMVQRRFDTLAKEEGRPDLANKFDEFRDLRNRLVHGDLDVDPQVAQQELLTMRDLLIDMVGLVGDLQQTTLHDFSRSNLNDSNTE